MERQPNALIEETSPYLLQHAYNPVKWLPWGEKAFEQARSEDKLVLVSIGYAACHWCHVMEHESFEEEAVAELMNRHFICIKVDREERPDVDQIYMTAVQLMTQRGGWPLNCFTLPDGRPVFGGTYFPREQWLHVLRSLEHTYRNDRSRTLEYAEALHQGIIQSDLIQKSAENISFSREKLHEMVLRWSRSFDRMEGGGTRAPKFPLPNNLDFLMAYAYLNQDQKILNHVELTLDKMAMGGIYDQIGGGFARYSVDMLWKVPHFEKMLYDNGQLLFTYAQAYKLFSKNEYRRVVYQTVSWLERELLSQDGGLYAALDADSEGEEGKFYCWTEVELDQVLSKEDAWAKRYFSVDQHGHWEETDSYILLRRTPDKEFCRREGFTEQEFEEKLSRIIQKLLDERGHRERPSLDNKILTSWNAMAVKGLCASFEAFGEENFLQLARKTIRRIEQECITKEYTVYRSVDQKGRIIKGFLEDYVHTAEAMMSMYSVTFDADYIFKAEKIVDRALELFGDPESQMCFYTEQNSGLIARKMELNDNVMPAANSVLANVLFDLGMLNGNTSYIERSRQMLANMYEGMEQYGSGYSNWGILLFKHTFPYLQMVVSGKDAKNSLANHLTQYQPNAQFAVADGSDIALVKDKTEGSGRFYLCVDGVCSLPVSDAVEFEKLIRKERNLSYS
ncbi:MAG: hypothetical protein RIT43_1425 [Bacteroidota bacterium]